MHKSRILLTVFLYTHILGMDTHEAVISIPSAQKNENVTSKNESHQPCHNQPTCNTCYGYYLTEGAIKGAKYGLITGVVIGGCTMTGYFISNQVSLTNVYPVVLGSLVGGTALGTITGMLLGLSIGATCSAHAH